MEKMLICVDEDIYGYAFTNLTYECEESAPGTVVEIVSGRLQGMTGQIVGLSDEEFPYYEKARMKMGV